MQPLAEDFWCSATWFAREDSGADATDAVQRDEHSDEQRKAGTISDAGHCHVKRRRIADDQDSACNETAEAHENLG